jgi:hypothetical protein
MSSSPYVMLIVTFKVGIPRSFGILQYRESLASARLQMHRSTFEREARTIASVRKVALAWIEEEQSLPITGPALRLLRKSPHGALGCVTCIGRLHSQRVCRHGRDNIQ